MNCTEKFSTIFQPRIAYNVWHMASSDCETFPYLGYGFTCVPPMFLLGNKPLFAICFVSCRCYSFNLLSISYLSFINQSSVFICNNLSAKHKFILFFVRWTKSPVYYLGCAYPDKNRNAIACHGAIGAIIVQFIIHKKNLLLLIQMISIILFLLIPLNLWWPYSLRLHSLFDIHYLLFSHFL